MKTEPDWVPGKVKTKMKKLMFVATAALCAAVGFGDITSQNVVGYNTLNDGNSSVMLGCTFADVTGTSQGVKLGALVGNFEAYDGIQIAYMQNGVIEFTQYQYLTEDDGVAANGWYDGSWESAADVVIPRGSAVWFVSSSGTSKDVTSAGEVPSTSMIHPAFAESSNMICSAYPVEFNPNAVSVAWSGLKSYDEIQVSYVNEGIIEFNQYQWLTEDDGVDEAAWYDGNWEKVTVPIAAVGQGFWLVLSNPDAVTMAETSPLAK